MSREHFLQRVREATGRDIKAPVSLPPPPPAPSAQRTTQELVERFKVEQNAVLSRVHLAHSTDKARSILREILAGAATYIRSPHSVLDEVDLPGVAEEVGLRKAEAADADVGVTGCEFAVAATGSIALSSAWGRVAALLPPHHVVVLRSGQLVYDLNDLYTLLAKQERPAAWGMHTGPSKSADIEQTMALGVHGPGRVDVVVLC